MTLDSDERSFLREMFEMRAGYLLKAIEGKSNPLDALKQRIAYFEKLVVLDGVLLGLSLTAVSALRNNQDLLKASRPAFAHLVSAWHYFFFSVVLSILSNWISTSAITGHSNAISRELVALSDKHSKLLLILALPEPISEDIDSLLGTPDPESTRWLRHAHIAGDISNYVGILANICTVVALFTLYEFARVSILLP